MKIISDLENGYGCKNCVFNKLIHDSSVEELIIFRKCNLTGTIMTTEHIHAFIRGATLTDCPKSVDIPFDTLFDLIRSRYF